MENTLFILNKVSYIAFILGFFEFLPEDKRNVIDKKLTAWLSWKLLWWTFLIALLFNLLYRLFPFLSPFVLLAVLFFYFLITKLMSFGFPLEKRNEEGKIWTIVLYVVFSFLGAAIILSYLRPDGLQLFYATIFLTILGFLFGVVFKREVFTDYAILSFFGFLLVGLPSGVGHWVDIEYVNTLLKPITYVSDNYYFYTNEKFIIPKIEASYFVETYLGTIDYIESIMTEYLQYWKVYYWYRNSSDGYLFAFAIISQLVFLVLVIYILRAVLLIIAIPLIKFSNWLRAKFSLEKKNLPIAGGIILFVSETVKQIVETIIHFS